MPKLDPISNTISAATGLIKLFKNPEAKLKLQELANEHGIKLAELELDEKRLEIESESKQQTQEAEATKVALASRSWFVAGARPSMIWVGSLSLLINFVVLPVLSLTPWLEFERVHDLQMQAEHLWPIISGTGVVAALRTREKGKGVANN